ncbi:MAG: L-aspartate oxidase [Acidobacteriota bacterium]|nr:L-aspartate oxidase [Acidobacteriota bacterium]MDW3228551.1 L-aspartate oxidase [Acidobacteriota bacterium]MDY0230854.1 L-aspartate oxidase [Candidatus Saccharicenans sp.]
MTKKTIQEELYSDVLIIGCGIAGATVALEAARRGLQVNLVIKSSNIEGSNTYWAQGGIVSFGDDDEPALLKEDILKAGDRINNPESVELLVEEGKKAVDEVLINDLKVPFARSSPEKLDYALEGGHSRRRILHVADATGKTVASAFYDRLRQIPSVHLYFNHTAVDLLTVPHHSTDPLSYYQEPRCVGAYVLDNQTGRVKKFLAGYTVLATGGCSAVYQFTSNPRSTIGSGYAMALRAGARIVNMEYIQFHPTLLFTREADGFLISESVRGEGARLKTTDGRTFMEKYTPQRELAPRDEVTRAIYQEMINTNTSFVLLDLASYAKMNIKKRFPYIYKTCLEYGIDITKEPIPVVPAAHFCCGGVLTDLWGQTSLKGLYAVGEVACTGVHGANRLASTSLLEGLVWGIRTAKSISTKFEPGLPYDPGKIHPWYYPNGEERIDPALIYQDWATIRSTMWNYAGIIRTSKRLERAKADLEYLKHRIDKFYQEAPMNPEIVDLRHGLQVALMITYAALGNPESHGCHYRQD